MRDSIGNATEPGLGEKLFARRGGQKSPEMPEKSNH
jgi:hypothetical protein